MILEHALPFGKVFFRPLALPQSSLALLLRLVAAFLHHAGRMSATQAGSAIRADPRHRANILRFLTRTHWSKDWYALRQLTDYLLAKQDTPADGWWIFIIDPTQCGQQGQKTENTFSRGGQRPRAKPRRKYKASARRSCHSFVHGLLLTPSGVRLPFCRAYYTKTYCAARGWPYRTHAQIAAELIRQVPWPASGRKLVVGDTAFDSKDIRRACAAHHLTWLVPVNPERVLAGPTPRRAVTALASAFSATDYQICRLVADQGPLVRQRRPARCRCRSRKPNIRTFYVHQERQTVHSVGEVQLLFSTMQPPQAGQTVVAQKMLMTNDLTLTAAQMVELYDLRWQIELYFKELKSTLGYDQYRLRRFAAVEGWVQACLIAFVYLEYYRWRKQQQRALTAKAKWWWQAQRSHGLSRQVQQEMEASDWRQLYRWSGTRSGQRKLRRCLRAALPKEQRPAA